MIDAPDLTGGETIYRVLAATGYTLLCMVSIAAIAFALGMLLPRAAEALGIAVAFVITASILNGTHAFHILDAILPVHYWQDWTHLFDGGSAHLATGIVVQTVAIVVAACVAVLVVLRRDPAA